MRRSVRLRHVRGVCEESAQVRAEESEEEPELEDILTSSDESSDSDEETVER